MRIVDAVWEERNLGVTSAEISIEKSDDPAFVEQQLSQIHSQYSVVKLPSSMSAMLSVVQRCGFEFIEDMIHVEHDLRPVELPPVIKRLYDRTSYREMTEEDFAQLQDEIARGMFDSDRISSDSFFPEGAAARRYLNWTNDLRDQGALFYVITYGGQNSGFVVLKKQDDKTYYSVLGGGYEKFRRSGLGIIQKEPEITRALGGKRLVTSVSSNNVGQLKALIMNGYRPYSIDHVLIRHER